MKEQVKFYEKWEGYRILGPVVTYIRTNIGIIVAFAIMFTALSIATPNFLTVDNWINILRQITVNICLAVGVMTAIIINGIDLSGGATIALSGCVAVQCIVLAGMPVWAGVLIGLMVGAIVGGFNGSIIAFTGMPPFIVTLATQNISRGAAYLVANGQPIRIKNAAFETIGTGYLGPIPYPVIYALLILLFTWFVLNKTRFGRQIYAVGGNREAARFSGIKTWRVELLVYTFSGLFAAVAGIMFTARMASGQPAVGISYETDAVAASVLGGASMTGGVGTVGGLVVGALVLGILSNGLNLLKVNSFWQYVAKGIVIIIAVYIDMFRKRNQRF